jgi:hypothetical protein
VHGLPTVEWKCGLNLLEERSEPFAGGALGGLENGHVYTFADGSIDSDTLASVLVQYQWHRLVISEPSAPMS